MAEMDSAIAVRGHSRYFPRRLHDDTKDGAVGENQNGDGHDESKKEQINVEQPIGEVPRRVVEGTGDEESFRLEGRPTE